MWNYIRSNRSHHGLVLVDSRRLPSRDFARSSTRFRLWSKGRSSAQIS
jgi:hypothetical protein